MIRNALKSDAHAICRIYNHYILHTIVTLEEQAVDPAAMAARIGEFTERLPWLVVEQEGAVVGYAYAGTWKNRSGYRHTVECSIYLDPAFTGQGMGSELYAQLFEQLKGRSVHAVMAGIALPNQASVALHEKLGFIKVGHFREVGRKFDCWLDVGYWELAL